MRKELSYISIEGAYGGSQEWFSDFWMNLGGCGAVTACDICLYFASGHRRHERLIPFAADKLNKKNYKKLGMKMKRYLRPRMGGISTVEMFADGFADYMEDHEGQLRQELFHGTRSFEEARAFVKKYIDRGFPIAYLLLHHEKKEYKDINWHWFTVTGYEEEPDGAMKLIAATYGGRYKFPFEDLWNTGKEEKGGMVGISSV